MAYKSTGTAGKSASGASMSKYDVEVEARLKALESKADPVVGGSAFDQLNKLEAKLSSVSAADAVSLNARVSALGIWGLGRNHIRTGCFCERLATRMSRPLDGLASLRDCHLI